MKSPAKARLAAVLLAVAGSALPVAATVLAAEGEGGHGGSWADILYKTVNFIVLVGLLVYFLRKPVGAFLRTTAARTKQTLDDARAESADAERRLDQQQKNIESLQQELSSLQEEARREAENEKERLKAEANALARRFREQSRLQLEQARNQALAAIRRELAGEAARLAETMIRERMDVQRQRRLVAEHIAELEGRP